MLSVLEPPTGNEDDGDIDGNNSFCSSQHRRERHGLFRCSVPEANKAEGSAYKAVVLMHKVLQPRQFSFDFKAARESKSGKARSTHTVEIWEHFNLVTMNPNPSKVELLHGVQQHFQSQQLDELQVILDFIHTAKRLKSLQNGS
ncbi:hypothetical protein BS78_K186700 [Paspalum vaginatum]|uniref:Histone deacetylase complex subunit SAP30 Sin3 binding domain-containing protein n=1 Tax=Paspalum vaginatum TaxID=158149 RepID=A0A9W7X618_9POAL|nr:hypothetical protein BS78_K186700 [Paspalum vaginatum]KAJ1253784.1 hypothetical protein BS78_K186700 [Paspalum vaginatum]